MAEPTKRCPKCAETIKAAALVCRYCGNEFTPESIKAVTPGGPSGGAIAALVGLALVVGCVALGSGGGSDTKDDPDAQAYNVKASAEENLERALKDGESAQYGPTFVSKMDNGGLVYCGEVNSKNSFGGYTGYKRFIAGAASDAPVMLEGEVDLPGNLGAEFFPQAWARFCSSPVKNWG